MTDISRISPEELEKAAGGSSGSGVFRTVYNLKEGYLAIRSVPVADYKNEVNHTGLQNGDKVLVTGATVVGTGFDGKKATYTWIYSPQYNVSGYVNADFLK